MNESQHLSSQFDEDLGRLRTQASKKFIDGAPIKPATNRFAGLL